MWNSIHRVLHLCQETIRRRNICETPRPDGPDEQTPDDARFLALFRGDDVTLTGFDASARYHLAKECAKEHLLLKDWRGFNLFAKATFAQSFTRSRAPASVGVPRGGSRNPALSLRSVADGCGPRAWVCSCWLRLLGSSGVRGAARGAFSPGGAAGLRRRPRAAPVAVAALWVSCPRSRSGFPAPGRRPARWPFRFAWFAWGWVFRGCGRDCVAGPTGRGCGRADPVAPPALKFSSALPIW